MYIADLHIHSRYSMATSKECTPEYLDLWARRKGIGLIGTGDFTHPAWRRELKEKLMPAEDGLYILKEEYRIREKIGSEEMIPRFVISGEISTIYKKNEKTRKVHSVILLPGLEEADLLASRLEAIGNIHSDGRPILGLDCRDLLEITLTACDNAMYIPAHIWTPHFSVLGAASGFDSIEECFEDLAPHIHALETGLSSDPLMNWRISALDRFQMISNSDAHSPGKLGREANILNAELSYGGLYKAVQEGKGLEGTIEFFPEEGKYYYDGHRKCKVCLTPAETKAHEGKCPVCGRKLTMGVCHRIEQLADREEGFVLPGGRAYESLVPLPEVIAASVGRSVSSKRVTDLYQTMIEELGAEFQILRELPIEDISHASDAMIGEGIRRLREGRVERIPGYDGEYGVIRLFEQEELEIINARLKSGNSGRKGITKAETMKKNTEKKKIAQKTMKAQPDQEKVIAVLKKLDEVYGTSKENFYHKHDWQLLAAIMLSAQSTDKQVEEVIPDLFERFDQASELAEASLEVIEEQIKSIGLYKNKAKNLKKCCQQIVEEFGGKVPGTIEELLSLAGVGRKTATLYLADFYGIPGVTVDTHVFRISKRLGWANGKNPVEVELELQKVLPEDYWNRINFQLIYHGRAVCTARKANCEECMLAQWCEKRL